MVKIEDLEKALKENQISSLYLLYGKEKYLLETCLKKIKNAFGQCLKGINYIILDNESIQNLIQELEMPAFGFEKKLIIVKNIGLLKKEAKKKSTELANLKKAINEYITQNIERIKNSVVLIFIEDEVDKTELYNIIDKNGIVCEFAFQKPIEIKKRLKQICNAYKVNIEESTLQYFIECCGTDMQTLIN